jgi:hypothetical protein
MRREGVAVTPLQGGHAPKSEYIDNQWVALRDIADEGYYAFAPETFAPLPSGAPPKITLVIDDLKHPGSPRLVEIPPYAVARAWNDFEGYFRTMQPAYAFRHHTLRRVCGAGPMGGQGACGYMLLPPTR